MQISCPLGNQKKVCWRSPGSSSCGMFSMAPFFSRLSIASSSSSFLFLVGNCLGVPVRGGRESHSRRTPDHRILDDRHSPVAGFCQDWAKPARWAPTGVSSLMAGTLRRSSLLLGRVGLPPHRLEARGRGALSQVNGRPVLGGSGIRLIVHGSLHPGRQRPSRNGLLVHGTSLPTGGRPSWTQSPVRSRPVPGGAIPSWTCVHGRLTPVGAMPSRTGVCSRLFHRGKGPAGWSTVDWFP